MDVCVALEHRFDQTPDGAVWTVTSFSRSFWERYLDVFDRVWILARVRQVRCVPADWLRTDDRDVRILPLPYYLGPVQYATRWPTLHSAVRKAANRQQAFILRVPGNVSSLAYHFLRRQRRPYGVEVVADPYDVYAPGAIRHPLRPYFRRRSSRLLRWQCSDACAASYVTEEALQRRYPTAAPFVVASSIELPDAAFVTTGRVPHSFRRPHRLIAVGSLDHFFKGPDLLLRAVAACRSTGLDVHLCWVGDGRHRGDVEALASRLGLRAQVTFAGQVAAGPGVRAHLDDADLFVLPSRQEGLPRAMIEAMARALPCIGSDVGGVPELLPAEDRVPPNDVPALAHRIATVLGDRARLSRMSARNLAIAASYHDRVLGERRASFYRAVRAATERWREHAAGSVILPIAPDLAPARARPEHVTS